MSKLERDTRGLAARQWAMENGLTAEQMGNKMIGMFRYLFMSNKQPRPMYTVNKVETPKYERTGIVA
jgi:hypothetical protein